MNEQGRARWQRVVPLRVQQVPGSDDGLDQGVGPHRPLRRRLGAGVRLPALLVPHGFDVAAAPHPTTRDLIVFPAAGVTPPLILGHLGGAARDKIVDVYKEMSRLHICSFWLCFLFFKF